jgi:hypothetical protein
VIVDLVSGRDPGTVFQYPELIAALRAGTDREIDDRVVGRAVRAANSELLARFQRMLHSLPRVGYRLAAAAEHRNFALARREKASNQMEWAVKTLQNVRWDEMDANARAAHEGTLMVLAGLHQAIQAVQQTQKRHEKMIQLALSGVEEMKKGG